METAGTAETAVVTADLPLEDPLRDVVARQYERWVYPPPIMDVPQWLTNQWQWFDPRHSHVLFWPDRGYPAGLDILVAGCGTNQAAIIAYTNPSARVVAIDVSAASLEHHAYLVTKYKLTNLELHRLPVERSQELGRNFDLIISTGVLHHLADPLAGMRALANILRPEGVLAVMLYATHGRAGVQMLQQHFQDLGLNQDEESIRTVREVLARIGDDHPVAEYLELAKDWHDDAGLVDTFLHGREQSFTIGECQELVSSAGLVFQDLFFKAPYYAHQGNIAGNTKQQMWSAMETVNTRNACHYFLACHKERLEETYEIDFDSRDATQFVPHMRHGCTWRDGVIYRPDWHLELNSFQSALVTRVNGELNIDQIWQEAVSATDISIDDPETTMQSAVNTFRILWQFDFLGMGLLRTH